MTYLNLEKINSTRKEKGYTYKELSEITGISKSSLEKIFTGFNDNPTLIYMFKIARALEISLDDFIDNDEYFKEKKDKNIKKEATKISQYICENEKLLDLYQKIQNSKNEDIDFLLNIVDKLCNKK